MADPEFVEVVKISTWPVLVEAFEGLSDWWVCRGQQRASWELRTSLERHKPPTKPASQIEKTLLYEFPRRADLYVNLSQKPENLGEWLALMQHFGTPTRLLDFTRSPYVAAFFAVEAENDDDEDRAIWAVDTLWCKKAVGAATLAKFPWLEAPIKKTTSTLLVEHTAAIVLSLHFNEWVLENKVVGILPFEPDRLSERLSVQQGMFLCPADVDKTFVENLGALEPPSAGIKKFVIEDGERANILKHLRLMNITNASLFPGLDGYARSFRELLVEEPEDRRKTRMVRDALLVNLKDFVSVTERVAEESKDPEAAS